MGSLLELRGSDFPRLPGFQGSSRQPRGRQVCCSPPLHTMVTGQLGWDADMNLDLKLLTL